MPQNSNFRLPRVHRFFAKNGSYGNGAKSRWGSRGVYLGANGVPLGKKKWVKTVQIYHAPKFKFLTIVDHRFFPKNGSYGYGDKSRWGLPRVHHGANGSHWVQKIGQKRRKLPCPKIRILRSSIFCKKWKLGLWCQITAGTPWVLYWGQWGPIGFKTGQNRKKLPCPKIRIFDYPAVIDFSRKMEVTVMAPNHGWDPVRSLFGPMGSNWVQKMGQNRRK